MTVTGDVLRNRRKPRRASLLRPFPTLLDFLEKLHHVFTLSAEKKDPCPAILATVPVSLPFLLLFDLPLQRVSSRNRHKWWPCKSWPASANSLLSTMADPLRGFALPVPRALVPLLLAPPAELHSSSKSSNTRKPPRQSAGFVILCKNTCCFFQHYKSFRPTNF